MHRGIRFLTCAATAVILAACTRTTTSPAPVGTPTAAEPAPAAAASCDAAKVQWLVGQRVDDAARERARIEAGARIVRVLAPNQPATMDFNPGRLDIATDDAGVATRITCG